MERKRYFTLEQRNKMLKEQNKRIKIDLVKENVYLKDLLMQQKEVLDKIKNYLEEPNRDNFDFSKAIILEMIEELYD